MNFDVRTFWALACCSALQRRLLAVIGAYVVGILVLWRAGRVLLPFKLLAVLVHEVSHAAACWLTGGTVDAIEVRANGGGVTKYRGGWRRVVAPAGYLGGAAWGAAGTAGCASAAGRHAVVAVLGLALVASLSLSVCSASAGNRATTAATCGAGLGALGLACWADGAAAPGVLLYALLFLTTFVSAFSAYDIWDDCVRRYVAGDETSDAVVCARLCPVLPARGWGAAWLVAALALWAAGVFALLALV